MGGDLKRCQSTLGKLALKFGNWFPPVKTRRLQAIGFGRDIRFRGVVRLLVRRWGRTLLFQIGVGTRRVIVPSIGSPLLLASTQFFTVR